MKNCYKFFWIFSVFAIIACFCTSCDDDQPKNNFYLKTEKWNGFEFRQRFDATDNQYRITVDKFKTVFNSDLFSDTERFRIQTRLDIIVITGVGDGIGGWGGGYGTENYTLIYISCNSIQDEIEKCLRSILLW